MINFTQLTTSKKYDIVYCVRYNNVMLNKEFIYDKRKI